MRFKGSKERATVKRALKISKRTGDAQAGFQHLVEWYSQYPEANIIQMIKNFNERVKKQML